MAGGTATAPGVGTLRAPSPSRPAPTGTAAPGLADVVLRHVRDQPHRPALMAPDGTVWDYAGLGRLLERARAGLRSAARADGRAHLVHLRPAATPDFVVAWLACLAERTPVLLTDRAATAAAYNASLGRGDGAWVAGRATPPAAHPDLQLLLSTSGSTGSPKLVRLSAANLASNAAAIADYLGLGPDDVATTTLPLDYCYGLSVLHSHLHAGAAVVLDDRAVTDPDLWTTARAAGVTTLAGVPHTFEVLAGAGWPELPALRRVTQAGGRLAPDRVRDLAARGDAEGWELFVMYGQTEATARMAYLPPHLAASRPGCVGVAVPGGALHVDLTAGAETGGSGDVGELVYRGPNVMMGYAHGPADLARGPELDELRTGDLARITDDGLVEIVGRRSRFAKVLGQRIDLERLETLLRVEGHDVACAEARDGRGLVLAVRGGAGPVADDVLDEVERAAADATGLPSSLLRMAAVGDLPRLRNGKIDHCAVAALAPGLPPAPGGPADAIDPAHLVRLYARVLDADEVGPDDSFTSLGGDSLSYVEISLRLEQRLGVLPDDWPRRTIAELAAIAPRGARVPAAGVDGGARRPRRGAWARLETSIALRALAIVLIVGSHTDLWVILGGAHVLLAVAGANLARFHLLDEGAGARARRIVHAAGRVAVPSVLWLATVAVVVGDLPWRTVLLLNDVAGPHQWVEPAWHYWFVETLVWLMLGLGLLTALPWVRRVERAHPFACALGLTALALVPRFWVAGSHYDGDVIHSGAFVAWLFIGGWAAQAALGTRQRCAVSALLLVGVIGLGGLLGVDGFTGSDQRDLVIALGLLVLVWCRTLPWPRVLLRPTGTIASASLWIYLTHWQVYPWFEDRLPVAGLVLSLAVGVLVARVMSRVPRLPQLHHRLVRATRAGALPGPHYARHGK